MIVEQQSSFGFNLDSRRNRRVFVLLYCAFFALFLVLGLVWSRYLLLGGMLQSITLAGGLGGIRGGGPVKSFGGRQRVPGDLSMTTASYPVQSLNLEHQLPTAHALVRLDERETAERDHAHFVAFRLLRWIAAPLCLLLGVCLYEDPHTWQPFATAVLWTVIMLILALPQIVILWTEPDVLD